jgi:hypothetical protein
MRTQTFGTATFSETFMNRTSLLLVASTLALMACGKNAGAEPSESGSAKPPADATLVVTLTGVNGTGSTAECEIQSVAVNTSETKFFGVLINFGAVQASTGAELKVAPGIVPIGTIQAGASKNWDAAGVVHGATCDDVTLKVTEQHCSPFDICKMAFKSKGVVSIQPLAQP